MLKYSPRYVVWEITWKCNAKCIHCGSDCVSVPKDNELSTQECLKVIEDLSTLGAQKIVLSGGDPLLRQDFPVLAREIKKYGMNLCFITNAIALDDEKIRLLEDLKPRTFGISIDAGDYYIHDYIRGHKGCYNHALESVIKLKKIGIEPSVVTTVHQLNYPILPKLRAVLAILGVKAWQIQYADNIGRMRKDTMITEAQYKKLAEFILETQNLYKGQMYVSGADVVGYMNDLSNKIGLSRWQGCGAGIGVLGLGSNGTVRGCLSQQLDKYIEGNIRERSLIDIWTDPDAFSYNRKFDVNSLDGFCKTCEYAQICKGGCTRAASTSGGCRCTKYCLHKIDKTGFSDEYQSRTYFPKEEIAEMYNVTKKLPEEFYKYYDPCDDILNKFKA